MSYKNRVSGGNTLKFGHERGRGGNGGWQKNLPRSASSFRRYIRCRENQVILDPWGNCEPTRPIAPSRPSPHESAIGPRFPPAVIFHAVAVHRTMLTCLRCLLFLPHFSASDFSTHARRRSNRNRWTANAPPMPPSTSTASLSSSLERSAMASNLPYWKPRLHKVGGVLPALPYAGGPAQHV